MPSYANPLHGADLDPDGNLYCYCYADEYGDQYAYDNPDCDPYTDCDGDPDNDDDDPSPDSPYWDDTYDSIPDAYTSRDTLSDLGYADD